MYSNNRKLKNIQESNLRLERRYLLEQAPPPAPATPPAPSGTGSTPSNRTVIKPMVATTGPKAIKEKNGTVIEWKEQTDQQKESVAAKCGHPSVKKYEESKWMCDAEQSK